METLSNADFDSLVAYLFRRAVKVAPVRLPVDLFELAKLQRVTTVDLRPMVPTGGLSRSQAGFTIFIQDLSRSQPAEFTPSAGVENRPKLTARQRFTFAHELAHTLVFSDSTPPEPRKDSPRGLKLEALCHRAAGRILMPDGLLNAQIRKCGEIGSAEVAALARLFEVSVEAALSRCDEIPTLQGSNRAILYIRETERGNSRVVATLCPDWFQDRQGRPEYGMPPSKWLSQLVGQQGEFWNNPKATASAKLGDTEIHVRRVPFRSRAHFIELERHSTSSDGRPRQDDDTLLEVSEQ